MFSGAGYKRKVSKLKHNKTKFYIKQLCPADFIDQSFWPFSRFGLLEIKQSKKYPQPKRDWKIIPKEDKQDELKIEKALQRAFEISLGITSKEYEAVKKNKVLHEVLFGEIYSLTYGLTNEEKFFTPRKEYNKEFAEGLAVKAKLFHVEPYALVADLSREKPELYNPVRYDFNFFILGVGFEKERREMDRMRKEIEKKNRSKRRR